MHHERFAGKSLNKFHIYADANRNCSIPASHQLHAFKVQMQLHMHTQFMFLPLQVNLHAFHKSQHVFNHPSIFHVIPITILPRSQGTHPVAVYPVPC